jgi:DNA-binding SARP family transcriptional activator
MLRLTALGSAHLRADGAAGVMRLQPKRLAVLVWLGLEARGRPCRRDTLIAMFWPELDGARARNALSQALHGIRRAVGEDVVCGAGAEELWIDPGALGSDVEAFERALGEGRFGEAVELYVGPLLEGLHVGGAFGFEDWLSRRRERLRRRVSEALGVLIERAEREGNPAGAAERLRRLAELSPGDESVIRRWMGALSEAGDRAGALRVYERFAEDLAAEMELAPGPETHRLAERLREEGAAGREDTAPSIAVLPFADLGTEGGNEYFCHGLTEEIIGVLARERAVRVTARTSVFAAGGLRTGMSDRWGDGSVLMPW